MGSSVVVVDDDVSFRTMAARIVRSWGHLVVGEAGTVAEGLARATELRPDIVVVDVGLPDGDGFELTRGLLALGWPLRVLVISSDGDAANVSAAALAGASGFFPKVDIGADGFRSAIEGR